MITICLFGISAGLEVHPLTIGEASGVQVDDAWLEISPHDVTVKLDADLFKVYRRLVGGKLLTWIGLYRSATEIGSSRPGGYYGAGVWLHDVALPGRSICEVLVNLADQLKALALSNGKFVKRIADVKGSIVPPQQLSGWAALRGALGGGVSVNGMIQGFITDPKSVVAIIDWAQRSRTAELFSQIVVGAADQYVPQQVQFQKNSEKYESLHAAIDGAYAKRIALVEDVRKKLATDLDATKKETAQLKQSKESDQKKLQEATQKVSVLTARVDSLQRTVRPIDVRPAPQIKIIPPTDYAEHEPRSTTSIWLYAVVIVMCVSVLCLALVLYRVYSDAKQVKSQNSTLRTQVQGLEKDLLAQRKDNDSHVAKNRTLAAQLEARQQDGAGAPADDRSDAQVLTGLQAACANTKPESPFAKFRLTIVTQAKSTPQSKGVPDPKAIYSEIKRACKIQEKLCSSAFERLEENFVKSWDSKNSTGNIFVPESCEKASPIKITTYEFKLSRPIAEAIPFQAPTAKDATAVD